MQCLFLLRTRLHILLEKCHNRIMVTKRTVTSLQDRDDNPDCEDGQLIPDSFLRQPLFILFRWLTRVVDI